MRLRSLALALALACGFGTVAEARVKSPFHKVKRPKSMAKKVKPRKAPKRAKIKRPKHA
ncbi:MAG TPA: hypothetical protein VKX45_00845 [Bryobacteraceae bacterium]|jgi:hypothetical protein|nr:hypothetical protein [Bryobacteraceae bacterium]